MPRLLPLLLVFALAACDGAIDNAFQPEYVIESYQQVGAPLAPVYVLRNAPIGTRYDRSALAVTDAAVEVQLLAENGSVEARYTYTHLHADRYEPPAPAAEVLPLRRYRIEVRVPGFAPVVAAETLTPGDFSVVSVSADTATYGAAETLVFNVTRPVYPGRQAIFLFSTETLLDTLRLEDAVPFLRAILDRNGNGIPDADEPGADGRGLRLEDLRIGSSPLINEQTYGLNPDGSLRIEMPWIVTVFYGPNRVSANALDDNLFDFLRSQVVQQGGSTLSPGEIPNVLDRVENGAGIFGAYSRIEHEVFIRRPAFDS